MPTLAQLALIQKVNLAAHGIPVTVTPPGGSAVATTGIWHVPLEEQQPYGTDFQRREPRRLMELPRTDSLTAVPRGSIIAAADVDGGATKNWRADGLQRDDDPLRMFMILVPA